ncbi:MAG: hypothetical protein M5U05_14055 [Anaerolineales bacterium]|nr:hypothetical protein [Anaerolineales bacterium]
MGHFGDAHVEARAALLQVAHHARGGIQPEGGPARQHDRVRFLDQVHRVHAVHFAGAGRAAALIHAAHRSRFAQDHRAAGERLVVAGVPHQDARHVGDAVFVNCHVFRLR